MRQKIKILICTRVIGRHMMKLGKLYLYICVLVKKNNQQFWDEFISKVLDLLSGYVGVK